MLKRNALHIMTCMVLATYMGSCTQKESKLVWVKDL